MTPETDAIKLLSEFYSLISGMELSYISKLTTFPNGDSHYETAKKCTFLHIEKLIESSPSLPIKGDGGYFYEDIELSTEHFKKIKTELEKL